MKEFVMIGLMMLKVLAETLVWVVVGFAYIVSINLVSPDLIEVTVGSILGASLLLLMTVWLARGKQRK